MKSKNYLLSLLALLFISNASRAITVDELTDNVLTEGAKRFGADTRYYALDFGDVLSDGTVGPRGYTTLSGEGLLMRPPATASWLINYQLPDADVQVIAHGDSRVVEIQNKPPRYREKAILQCLPNGADKFGLVFSKGSGCTYTPSIGQRCGDFLNISYLGRDPKNQTWKTGMLETIFLCGPKSNTTFSFDRERDTFSMHNGSVDTPKHLIVEKNGAQVSIDAAPQGSTDLIPDSNTHGPQTDYVCTWL